MLQQRSLSLSVKLILILLCITTTILTGLGFYGYEQKKSALYERFETSITLTKDRLLMSLPNVVWNFELASVNRILESELASDYLEEIILLDDQGALFKGLTKNESGPKSIEEAPDIDDSYRNYQMVYLEDGTEENAGTLYLKVSDKPIQLFLRNEIKNEVIKVLVLNGVIILLFSLSINTAIRPLRLLTSAAAKIASGDLNQNVESSRKDEIGVLAKQFESMRVQIRKKLYDLEEINKAGEDIAGAQSQDQALSVALSTMFQKTNVEKASVFLLGDDNKLALKTCLPLQENIPSEARTFGLDEGIPSKALLERKVIYIADTAESELFQDSDTLLSDHKSVLCVPLLDQGRPLGVMNFSGEVGKVRFEPSDNEFAESLARAVVITIKNIRMRETIEEHNRTLEQKVAERTAALQEKTNDILEMMRNMHQGLFTILTDGTIHHEYASYLETIFSTDNIAGRQATDLLFSHSKTSTDIIDQVATAIFTISGADEMMWDFNSHLLVSEYTIEEQGKEKILSLEWDPIILDDSIDKIMVTVRDITELKRLEHDALTKRRELDIISQIIKLNDEKFANFITSSKAFLQENSKLIQSQTRKNDDSVALLFRNMHTIKGNARTLGLSYITEPVHNAENIYDTMRSSNSDEWPKEILLNDIEYIESLINEYLKVYEEDLGKSLTDEKDDKHAGISDEDSNQLLSFIYSLEKSGVLSKELSASLDNARSIVERTRSIPFTEALNEVCQSILEIANELGKDTPEIEIVGGETFINRDTTPLLNNIFSHLLRNAIDHGIEPADKRIKAGKSAQGHIHIDVEKQEEGLEIHLYDDGQGLNIPVLRKKGEETGVFHKDDEPSEKELAELIFLSGMSTKSDVSDISGRGVGMDAVKKFIEQQGGSINIVPQKMVAGENFVPFETVIHLPPKLC